jgi:hypothetical protein
MGTDARGTGNQGDMDLEFGAQIEEILKEQIMGLESKIRLQLEEKAIAMVEEECKKRLKTLRESIREEIQNEVESWVAGELARRMEEFKKRNEKI